MKATVAASEQVVGVNTSPKSTTKTAGFLRFCAEYFLIPNPPQSNPTPICIQSPAFERPHNSNTSGSGRSSSSELEQVFTYFDEDCDGKISASELQTCLRAVGSCNLSDEDAEEAIRSSDADGDGMLGFNDFAKLMENAGDQELREAFGMYSDQDTTDGGAQYITARSLKKMMSRLGQSTTMSSCKAMISQFDLNGDCRLNFAEFRTMMR